ncbi:MAG TPA: hypothetical protein VKA21_12145 [Candidatus Binatia bacterium]|nr:hypothetical protein [Candidatus Binatia bacterium]
MDYRVTVDLALPPVLVLGGWCKGLTDQVNRFAPATGLVGSVGGGIAVTVTIDAPSREKALAIAGTLVERALADIGMTHSIRSTPAVAEPLRRFTVVRPASATILSPAASFLTEDAPSLALGARRCAERARSSVAAWMVHDRPRRSGLPLRRASPDATT